MFFFSKNFIQINNLFSKFKFFVFFFSNLESVICFVRVHVFSSCSLCISTQINRIFQVQFFFCQDLRAICQIMHKYFFFSDAESVCTDCLGVSPPWLLYLCIAFGILFLVMLIINVFLCSAMTCSCARTDTMEKEPSIIEEFDPYTRSWQGSQYGSRWEKTRRNLIIIQKKNGIFIFFTSFLRVNDTHFDTKFEKIGKMSHFFQIL